MFKKIFSLTITLIIASFSCFCLPIGASYGISGELPELREQEETEIIETTVATTKKSEPVRMEGQAPLVYVPADCGLRVTVTWNANKPELKLISPDKTTYLFFDKTELKYLTDKKAELTIVPAASGQWQFQYAGGDKNCDIFVDPFLLYTEISEFTTDFSENGDSFSYNLNTKNAGSKEIFYEISVVYNGNQTVVDSGRSKTNTPISSSVNVSEIVPNGQEYRVNVKVEYYLQKSIASVIASGGTTTYLDENKPIAIIKETTIKNTEPKETTGQTVELPNDSRIYSDKNNNSSVIITIVIGAVFIFVLLILLVGRAKK